MVKKGRFIDPEQINRMISLVMATSNETMEPAVLVGGIAMQVYGSDRLTKDIDFISTSPFTNPGGFKRLGPINFGGDAFEAPDGARLDYIVRNDEYKDLYGEAIKNSVVTEDGIPIVTPEYLAAMKLGAKTDTHLSDLKWLIKSGQVDQKRTENIVYRLMGGKFAQDTFRAIFETASIEAEREQGKP